MNRISEFVKTIITPHLSGAAICQMDLFHALSPKSDVSVCAILYLSASSGICNHTANNSSLVKLIMTVTGGHTQSVQMLRALFS